MLKSCSNSFNAPAEAGGSFSVVNLNELDQIRALASGDADLALVSSRAMARWLKSEEASDAIGFKAIIGKSGFPHTNVSGLGILEKVPNLGPAIQFAAALQSMHPPINGFDEAGLSGSVHA